MAAQQLLKIVYALDIKFWVRWCTCSMWRMLLPYYLPFLISILFLKTNMTYIIGERSELPSDKLGGEPCIATRALVFIIYAYGLTTVPCPRYMLRPQRVNIILRSPFNVLHFVLVYYQGLSSLAL